MPQPFVNPGNRHWKQLPSPDDTVVIGNSSASGEEAITTVGNLTSGILTGAPLNPTPLAADTLLGTRASDGATVAVGLSVLPFPYDASLSGVAPTASAAANIAALNAALVSFSWVTLTKPGTYLINASVVMPSARRLTLGPGVTVRLADNSRCYILVNSDQTNGNSDITIEGGTWDGNWSNNGAVGNYPAFVGHALFFDRVDRLTLRDFATTGATKFAILISRVTNTHVRNIDFVNTHSDGVHVYGPASNLIIENLRGTTGDDMVALGIGDYAGYQIALGDISDVVVRNLFPVAVKRVVNLYAIPLSGYTMQRITVDGVSGSSQTAVVNIGSDTTSTVALKDITLRGLKAAAGAANAVVAYSWGSGSDVTVEDCHITAATSPFFQVVSGAVLDSLRASNVVGMNPQSAHIFDIQGTVNRLHVMNARGVLTTSASFINAAGTVPRISLNQVSCEGQAALLQGGAAYVARLTNVYVNGGSQVYFANGHNTAQEIHCANVHIEGLSGAWFVIGGSTGTGTLRITGDPFIGGAYANRVYPGSPAKAVSVDSRTLSLGSGSVTPQAMDTIRNITGGTLGGVGIYMRDAANTLWKNLFTGTTY